MALPSLASASIQYNDNWEEGDTTAFQMGNCGGECDAVVLEADSYPFDVNYVYALASGAVGGSAVLLADVWVTSVDDSGKPQLGHILGGWRPRRSPWRRRLVREGRRRREQRLQEREESSHGPIMGRHPHHRASTSCTSRAPSARISTYAARVRPCPAARASSRSCSPGSLTDSWVSSDHVAPLSWLILEKACKQR